MNRLLEVVVITWALFYIAWAFVGCDCSFLERVSLALVVTGSWTCVSVGLIRHLRIGRFLFLLAVIGRIVFLKGETDLGTSEYYDYDLMLTNPATSWATNFSMLLDGLVLAVAYLTPVATALHDSAAEAERWRQSMADRLWHSLTEEVISICLELAAHPALVQLL